MSELKALKDKSEEQYKQYNFKMSWPETGKKVKTSSQRLCKFQFVDGL